LPYNKLQINIFKKVDLSGNNSLENIPHKVRKSGCGTSKEEWLWLRRIICSKWNRPTT